MYPGMDTASNYSGGNPKKNAEAHKTSDVLFYGSIISFISGILLLMSFASPYWLQSWAGTESPFENMGLWEFCFHNFRHPDYQYDTLFDGCHWVWGNEYRYIREKLLPGWLIVVQFFATLALMASYSGQCITVALLLRWPLDIILRFEVWFCGTALVLNACTSALMFLSVVIFYAQCWARDWLLYPNWNYPSWSYAFACFTCVGHCIAAIFLYWDAVKAKERKAKNKALLMQMHPQASLGFSSIGHSGRQLYAGGSYATGGGASGHGASGQGSGYI